MTGSMPGIAASTKLTLELGSAPNCVEAPENSLALEETCAWTSRPSQATAAPRHFLDLSELDGAVLVLALGVTTIFDPSNDATEIFAAADMQRAGQILAPRIYSTGDIVYGARSAWFAEINSLDDAREHVRRLKAQGAISVKNYNQPRRNQRQQVAVAAREEGMLTVGEGGQPAQLLAFPVDVGEERCHRRGRGREQFHHDPGEPHPHGRHAGHDVSSVK